jgi:hypothetical protein
VGGDPLPGRGLYWLPQHTFQITAGRRYLEWRWPFTSLHAHREWVPAQTRNVVGRLKVAEPVSKTDATAVGFAVDGSACHQ